MKIIFNDISARDISQLPILEQLEVLNDFKINSKDLESLKSNTKETGFAKIQREGKVIYRYRAKDVRIYFEVLDDNVSVEIQRVFNKNSFQDFLYRAKLPVGDDEYLAESKYFWELIESSNSK